MESADDLTESRQQTVRAVTRAGNIVVALAAQPHPMSVRQLAKYCATCEPACAIASATVSSEPTVVKFRSWNSSRFRSTTVSISSGE